MSYPIAYYYSNNENYHWYCGYDEEGKLTSVHLNQENGRRIINYVTEKEAENMETRLLLSGWIPMKRPGIKINTKSK